MAEATNSSAAETTSTTSAAAPADQVAKDRRLGVGFSVCSVILAVVLVFTGITIWGSTATGFIRSQAVSLGLLPATTTTTHVNTTDQLPADNPYRSLVNDYVFPASSESALTDEQIATLDAASAMIARNEIAARHGRAFDDPNLAAYFTSKWWYSATTPAADFDASASTIYSEVEASNMARILAFEQANGFIAA